MKEIRNYRIEQQLAAETYITADGSPAEITYASEEHSAYEQQCPACQSWFSVAGIMGALYATARKGLCPDCCADPNLSKH